MKAKVADWIRFQRDNKLVIGEVKYAQELRAWPWGEEYVTDIGTVREADVLEVRGAPDVE